MSKYEELAGVAIGYSEKHFASKQDCQRVAFQIAKEYQEFLKAPHDAIKFMELDAPLKTKGSQANLSKLVPLVKGDDNYWYFAIMLKLESPVSSAFMHEIIHVGIKSSEKNYHIKCEREFKIPKSEHLNFQEFFNFIFEDSKERYLKGKPSKNIGFIVNE